MAELSQTSAKEFAATILPLYCGPHVNIRIEHSEQVYTISKSLLCANSSFFSAIFDGQTTESSQSSPPTVTLEKVEGVVSVQSLEALLQWLYLRMVRFDVDDPGYQISAAIELARLADMCHVSGLEVEMARCIRNVLIANPNPESNPLWRHADTNTFCLTSQHIASASVLPGNHLVRHILAEASVEGYLRDQNHKFAAETQRYPSFGADFLKEVSIALNGLKSASKVAFQDPVSENWVELNAIAER
ncbi:hypothetical protein N7476_005145 [Penicillium atrosanguineum]|uniref:BTB domain-containing protein n=1 Tax=Penicillium atrosanguineum TaxID=1132637 RepID=A0A9W9Q0N4_9EURO|nr:hypothetical protein N7476_005145 [Penicillium atrosanguineum]